MTKEQAEQVLNAFVEYSIETEYEGYVSMDLKGMIYEIEDLDLTPYELIDGVDDENFLDLKLLAEKAINILKTSQ